jgi:TonB family protein
VDIGKLRKEVRPNQDHVLARDGSTYLLRSIAPGNSDTLIAFRVERILGDGSAIIVWRILASWASDVRRAESSPVIPPPERTNRSEITPAQEDRVTVPVSVLFKVDPECTKKARAARLGGTVLLSIIVDAEGRAGEIRVVRGLGMGLDEKAIEALQKWRFSPAMKNSIAVPTRAQVEINFRP